jgi:hypothetical protein
MIKTTNLFLSKLNILHLLIISLFCSSGCEEETKSCPGNKVLFAFDIDFSLIPNYDKTKQTTDIKVYYEEYLRREMSQNFNNFL